MTTQTLYLIDEYLMQGGYTPGIDAETLEREAHLVAAAPDMLDALIKARMWVGQYNTMPGHDAASVAMCNVIDQAIAKARGN